MPSIDYKKQLKNKPFESFTLTIATGATTVSHNFTFPWSNTPIVTLGVLTALPVVVMAVGNVHLTVPDYPVISALSTSAMTLEIQQIQNTDLIIHVNCIGNPN